MAIPVVASALEEPVEEPQLQEIAASLPGLAAEKRTEVLSHPILDIRKLTRARIDAVPALRHESRGRAGPSGVLLGSASCRVGAALSRSVPAENVTKVSILVLMYLRHARACWSQPCATAALHRRLRRRCNIEGPMSNGANTHELEVHQVSTLTTESAPPTRRSDRRMISSSAQASAMLAIDRAGADHPYDTRQVPLPCQIDMAAPPAQLHLAVSDVVR